MGSDIAKDVWQVRADVFLRGRRSVLTWAREAKDFTPTEADLRQVASPCGITAIAQERRLAAPCVQRAGFLELSDIPDALARPLLRDLGEIGGYDPALPYERQTSSAPEKQHGTMLFTAHNRLSECIA